MSPWEGLIGIIHKVTNDVIEFINDMKLLKVIEE
ncbi:hypothetical protein SDC9_112704 [bioreactor metagenome]|uniref:Uncharacterized protein n=2 Tax=root TaxID=1 RepID=A0ABS4K6X1_9CLOT|nr:hypothetical protein M918_16505 [Clostridium sp. BL8]MBP2022369.1 hypothetical protein [Clostridium punense]